MAVASTNHSPGGLVRPVHVPVAMSGERLIDLDCFPHSEYVEELNQIPSIAFVLKFIPGFLFSLRMHVVDATKQVLVSADDVGALVNGENPGAFVLWSAKGR
jgi:hypothetical protein